jgi:hypothetical protein
MCGQMIDEALFSRGHIHGVMTSRGQNTLNRDAHNRLDGDLLVDAAAALGELRIWW